MFVAATLSLLATVIPQGPTSGGTQGSDASKPLLSEREQKSLADRLRQYLADDADYERASGVKDREKTGKARLKAKEKFDSEWAKAEKKGNLVGSMVDLRAIFYNCFDRPAAPHGKGQLYNRSSKEPPVDFGILVPKKYNEKTPWPLMLVLPGSIDADSPGNWVKPADYFDQTWAKASLIDKAIVCLPKVAEGLELDPVPDYSKDGAEALELSRNATVLAAFGNAVNTYNVERGQVFLDCGRGACGYGLRLATLFPDRFAGIVLRDPVAIDELRVGSMLGTSILMIKTGANAAVVDALQKRIDEKCPGAVTVIDAKGEYPYAENVPDIEQWMEGKRRDMCPSRVVLEPNHDRYNKGFWVVPIVVDALLTSSPDKKPRLEVKADRAANRITVDTLGVERFQLLLNDDLVDLDKEFSVVINGKAVAEKRRRSFNEMKDGVVERSDWEFLFSVKYETTVPKE